MKSSFPTALIQTALTRTAFTLVKLLVVIAIIGILIAMLLPAVQKVREAARRASCLNNMRQLALSAHMFHDSKHGFPPSAVGGEQETIGFGPARAGYITWPAFLLPFLEQGNLANKIDFDYSAYVSDSTGQHDTLAGAHPSIVTATDWASGIQKSGLNRSTTVLPTPSYFWSGSDTTGVTSATTRASTLFFGRLSDTTAKCCTGTRPTNPRSSPYLKSGSFGRFFANFSVKLVDSGEFATIDFRDSAMEN